jgi:hypothetical protein
MSPIILMVSGENEDLERCCGRCGIASPPTSGETQIARTQFPKLDQLNQNNISFQTTLRTQPHTMNTLMAAIEVGPGWQMQSFVTVLKALSAER